MYGANTEQKRSCSELPDRSTHGGFLHHLDNLNNNLAEVAIRRTLYLVLRDEPLHAQFPRIR